MDNWQRRIIYLIGLQARAGQSVKDVAALQQHLDKPSCRQVPLLEIIEMQLEKNRRLMMREKFSRAFNGLELVPFDVNLDKLRNHIETCGRIANTFHPHLHRLWFSPHRVLKVL